MQRDDLAAVEAVCEEALWGPRPPDSLPWWRRRRLEYLLETDPEGCWVAVDPVGAVTGLAMAIRRERLAGLALLAVSPDAQGAGTGAALVDRALTHGEGLPALIMSTEHPGAMRLYARAGFALRPSVTLSGAPRFIPEVRPQVRTGEARDLGWIDDVARRARGAGYSREIDLSLRFGGQLHVVDGAGFALGFGAVLTTLAADDEDTAAALLEAFIAGAPRGAELHVNHITAGHDWAIRVGLDAGMVLSPQSAVFVRGEPGHLRPYLPSGAFL